MNQKTIVTNSRPAYIAEACNDENDNVDEVVLTPVVAWAIELNAKTENENYYATPITTEFGLPSKYAIYYSDTEQWSFPDDTWGSSLGKLLAHFKELQTKSKC